MGNNRYWNVFAIVDGQIIVKNTITSSPDVSYVPDSESSTMMLDFDDTGEDQLESLIDKSEGQTNELENSTDIVNN